MSASTNELMESYYRCRHDAGFLDSFYDLFLAKSPAIAEKFVDTDFKMQKLMLRQSLLEMLCFERGMAGTKQEIEQLGIRHQQLDVSPDMYAMWLDALCEAIRKHDPNYTPELEAQWREAMLTSIRAMVAAGKSSQPDGD